MKKHTPTAPLLENFPRRGFLAGLTGLLAAAPFVGKTIQGSSASPTVAPSPDPGSPGGGHEGHHPPDHGGIGEPPSPPLPSPNGSYVPCVAPGIETLPYTLENGVKVFQLTAEPVTIRFQDMSDPNGLKTRPINAWGYNGSVIGPTIEAVEGDRVRIHVTNRLSDPTSVHWHGLHLPVNMDGVTGISQDPILPGATFTYEFTLVQHGTYFYHPHFMGAKQVGMGMSGFFIVHPKNPSSHQIVDRDYAYFLQTWMIHPSSPIPDTMEMNNFNYFTMNGRPAPGIEPMEAKIGERIRIRMVNLSMLTHPIHLHGHTFKVTEYGAGFVPPEQQIPANTINISAAEERTLEFIAGPNPGRWIFHCHFMHHTMNDMHRPPIPGAGRGHGGHMGHDMGGMHTWIDVTE